MGSNYCGTLFFFITFDPKPKVKSTISLIIINLGYYYPLGGSETQKILSSSSLRYSFLWTNLILFRQTFKNTSPFLSYLVSFNVLWKSPVFISFSFMYIFSVSFIYVANFEVVILSYIRFNWSTGIDGHAPFVFFTKSYFFILAYCLGLCASVESIIIA